MNINYLVNRAVEDYLDSQEETIVIAISEAIEENLDIESLVANYIARRDLEDIALDFLLD